MFLFETVFQSVGQFGSQTAQVEFSAFAQIQFRIQARGFGNIGNQTVQTVNVMMNDLHQPRAILMAAIGGLSESGLFQSLHGAVQRGERIFQFMRHISGKSVNRIDAAQQAFGHIAQGLR